jgi:hypothetical protein
MVDSDWFARFEQMFGAEVALLLELIRTSGLSGTRQRDGWGSLDHKRRATLGMADRIAHHRAARRLQAFGAIDVRSRPGCKLEYRLNPDWAKPKAKIIDLVTAKRAQAKAQARKVKA